MDEEKAGHDTTALPARVARRVHDRTSAVLGAAPTSRAVADLAAAAMDIAEEALAEARQDDTVQQAISDLHCRKYCAHCCYKTVSVTPLEAIHLAEHVKTTLRPKALAKLKNRLRDLEERTRGMTPVDRGRARLPCALLVGRLCIAHAARPARCRGFNSRDVRACEQSVRRRDVKIPVFLLQYQIFDQASRGLSQGLRGAGLGAADLELTAALRIALDTPDAAERWLAGEPVFRAAALT